MWGSPADRPFHAGSAANEVGTDVGSSCPGGLMGGRGGWARSWPPPKPLRPGATSSSGCNCDAGWGGPPTWTQPLSRAWQVGGRSVGVDGQASGWFPVAAGAVRSHEAWPFVLYFRNYRGERPPMVFIWSSLLNPRVAPPPGPCPMSTACDQQFKCLSHSQRLRLRPNPAGPSLVPTCLVPAPTTEVL